MPNETQPPKRWIHKAQIGSYVDVASDREKDAANELEQAEGNDIKQKQGENKQDLATSIQQEFSRLLQAEHLNLLIGNGLTTAVAGHMGVDPDVNPMRMSTTPLECTYGSAIQKAAEQNASEVGREKPNIEHTIRAIHDFIQGLQVASMEPGDGDRFIKKARKLEIELSGVLKSVLAKFLNEILTIETKIRSNIEKDSPQAQLGRHLLESFLLTFANRTAARDRLHVFTTNYDRLIEFGSDLLGLRIIDRFVGELEPVFRASRLGIDMHYNPPGIRGEPRYLGGVIRLTKLHGSIDWREASGIGQQNKIIRAALPFGAAHDHSEALTSAEGGLMIYPNPAKDIETIAYPYAELFRDFAAAICQPNTVLVTYGYGFGDDHINRILNDMLAIPSTHIVIISFNDADGRIVEFYNHAGSSKQISLLIGPHFGHLKTLVDRYLPKPMFENMTHRTADSSQSMSTTWRNTQNR